MISFSWLSQKWVFAVGWFESGSKQGPNITSVFLKFLSRDFCGGPVAETSPPAAGAVGSIPGWEAGIPHASRPKYKMEAML